MTYFTRRLAPIIVALVVAYAVVAALLWVWRHGWTWPG
jgi:hypothetical protein